MSSVAPEYTPPLPDSGFKRRGNRRAGGLYSPDSRYRYRLWQRWDSTRGNCCFVLTRPGPQDEAGTDPVLVRLAGIAAGAGCGGMDVVTLFARRAPNWSDLERSSDPVGPANDVVLMHAATSAAMVVCAWGQHGLFMGRGRSVQQMLESAGIGLFILGETAAGHPEHPSLVSFDRQPVRWR